MSDLLTPLLVDRHQAGPRKAAMYRHLDHETDQGLFLLWKSSTEMYQSLEDEDDSQELPSAAARNFMGIIIQIAIIDIVFGLDSTITAVGRCPTSR